MHVVSGPVYDFHDWRLAEQNAERLVYRPSGPTMFRRCWTLVSAAALTGFLGTFGLPVLREIFRQEHIQLLHVAVPLFSLALLWPVSGFWQQIVLERNPRGVAMRTRWLFPKSRLLRVADYTRVVYGAQQYIFRNKRGGVTEEYWAWYVRMEAPVGRSGESPAVVSFFPLRERTLSTLQKRPPERVTLLVNWLYLITQLPVEGPRNVEAPLIGRWGRLARGLGSEVNPSTHQFESLDQVPEQYRDLAARLMQEAEHDMAGVGVQFRYMDSDGKQQMYESLEAMPPEVRAIFEQMQRGHDKN
jgi:hypothetical protein